MNEKKKILEIFWTCFTSLNNIAFHVLDHWLPRVARRDDVPTGFGDPYPQEPRTFLLGKLLKTIPCRLNSNPWFHFLGFHSIYMVSLKYFAGDTDTVRWWRCCLLLCTFICLLLSPPSAQVPTWSRPGLPKPTLAGSLSQPCRVQNNHLTGTVNGQWQASKCATQVSIPFEQAQREEAPGRLPKKYTRFG